MFGKLTLAVYGKAGLFQNLYPLLRQSLADHDLHRLFRLAPSNTQLRTIGCSLPTLIREQMAFFSCLAPAGGVASGFPVARSGRGEVPTGYHRAPSDSARAMPRPGGSRTEGWWERRRRGGTPSESQPVLNA